MRELTVSEAVRAEYVERGCWDDRRLLERIEESVASHGEKAAVVDETRSLTYAEIWTLGSRLAGWLAGRGVGHGSVVSVQLPNWWEFAVIHVATEMLGAVLNPLLPIYGERELRHVISTCESKVLVVPARHRSRDAYAAIAARLLGELPSLAGVLVVRGEEGSPADGLADFAAALGFDPLEPSAGVGGDAPVLVAFTSGTESDAKGCVHSSNTSLFALRSAVDELGLGKDDVVYMPSPLGHATGINWGMRLAFLLGTTLVLQDRWDVEVACELIRRHGCRFSLSATPFILELVDYVEREGRGADFDQFRMFVSGGAPIPRELVQRTQTVLGTELLACYGQAETWMVSLVRPGDALEIKADSDGRLMPGVEVRVLDDLGQEVGPGERGECTTRGPHVMLGYLNPPADFDFQPGGWLGMGDYVTVDEGGRLQVVGRKKEIIIRGGVNISPREVEEMLITHPAVAQVAVVGYPERRLGERACAVVVAAPGEAPTLESLTEHLRQLGCATYKLPERLELIPELPMTPSGKVQKVKLKDWLASEPSDPSAVPSGVTT
ncbi:MAG TPA: AMP-binding protein [Solirubrobacterales bacterium]|nr:AMP-binding protein [Solirubrobacterales bacterium]